MSYTPSFPMGIFGFLTARSEAKEQPLPKAWPTELNPCPYGGNHGKRPWTKCSWWCHDRVTTICSACVWELERKLEAQGVKDARYEALKTFRPDPNGSPCTRS